MVADMRIAFEPIGRRVDVQPGTTLLDAARLAGVDLVAVCGGGGTCGTCQVRLVEGQLSALSVDEKDQLSEAERAAGLRLACQAVPLSDARVDVPPQSLTAPQRTQLEGLEGSLELDPPVTGVHLELGPPSGQDLRADDQRLRDALARKGFPGATLSLPVAALLPQVLRRQGWKLCCAVNRAVDPPEVVALHGYGERLYGLAVDVGTTKLAAYLVDLQDGHTAARVGAMNPQIAYGEDVIARIAYCNQKPDGRQILQRRLVETLNQMLAQLCQQAGAAPEQVAAAVVVGNTVMHHLFAGIPVEQLGAAPYVPAVSAALEFPASLVGLGISPAAPVYLPPNIAGYVGADHVAMLLATDAWQAGGNVLAMDIGTNTEITLAAGGRLYACSCASGPAFEGAHIHSGMRAAPGAIERVQIRGGKVLLHTIGNQPPVGICGSGILDAVAELLGAGIVDRRGALDRSQAGVEVHNRLARFRLVPPDQTGSGQEIVVTREDVHQIQLAKAAIRAGVNILLREAGISATDLDAFLIAGAFGTYIDVENAVKIGMFPALALEKFQQVGNAAGSGARQLLLARQKRRDARTLAAREEYIELTTDTQFTNVFMEAIFFGE
jgi:uncharacterized 2Fe-2S/4Fe-4S cluster protein (DUF4445 family)